MSDKQAEIHLLTVLRLSCEQARRLSGPEVAKVAIRWEERLTRDLGKLEQAEAREANGGGQSSPSEPALVA